MKKYKHQCNTYYIYICILHTCYMNQPIWYTFSGQKLHVRQARKCVSVILFLTKCCRLMRACSEIIRYASLLNSIKIPHRKNILANYVCIHNYIHNM